ncbi:hypothetical protein DYB25_009702, partial [Aphanomyces astaci]
MYQRYNNGQRKALLVKFHVSNVTSERQFCRENDIKPSIWGAFDHYDHSNIINVDETAVYFDMPRGKTLAEVGTSNKVSTGKKHSPRLTAVLTNRADGTKLPLLFIVKGQPDGTIEKQELSHTRLAITT